MARLLHVALLLIAAAQLRADSLASARLAQALLGPDVWSRVVRIEHRRPKPRLPVEFWALVFAVEGRLWFYNPNEGTQSLSLYAGRLEQDEADPGPLLRVILPDLIRCDAVAADLGALRSNALVQRAASDLPYGCFILCVRRERELAGGRSPPDDAGILVFYVDTSVGRRGHSVLVHRRTGRTFVYDPIVGDQLAPLPAASPTAPLGLARLVCWWGTPFKAQLLTLHSRPAGPDFAPKVVTAAPSPPFGAGDTVVAGADAPTPAAGSTVVASDP